MNKFDADTFKKFESMLELLENHERFSPLVEYATQTGTIPATLDDADKLLPYFIKDGIEFDIDDYGRLFVNENYICDVIQHDLYSV